MGRKLAFLASLIGCTALLLLLPAAHAQTTPAWSLFPTGGGGPAVRYHYAATLHQGDLIVHGGNTGTLRTYSEFNDLCKSNC
jgi:hypothetical protein